jgi:RimJ/RimL family protein N-acetyltransferase
MSHPRAEGRSIGGNPTGWLSAFDRLVTLRDGTGVRLRPIRSEDAPRLIALYDRLSADTRYHRFFTLMRRLPPDWARFLAEVDYRTRLALVVESPDDAGSLIAVARYEPTDQVDVVEVAFVVQDGWQGRGLARCCSGSCWRRRPSTASAAFARGCSPATGACST